MTLNPKIEPHLLVLIFGIPVVLGIWIYIGEFWGVLAMLSVIVAFLYYFFGRGGLGPDIKENKDAMDPVTISLGS